MPLPLLCSIVPLKFSVINTSQTMSTFWAVASWSEMYLRGKHNVYIFLGPSIFTTAVPSKNLAMTTGVCVLIAFSPTQTTDEVSLGTKPNFPSQWQWWWSSLVVRSKKFVQIVISCLTRNIQSWNKIAVIFNAATCIFWFEGDFAGGLLIVLTFSLKLHLL